MIAAHRRHLFKSLISMNFYQSLLIIINHCTRSLPPLKIKVSENERHNFQSTYLQDELKRRAT